VALRGVLLSVLSVVLRALVVVDLVVPIVVGFRNFPELRHSLFALVVLAFFEHPIQVPKRIPLDTAIVVVLRSILAHALWLVLLRSSLFRAYDVIEVLPLHLLDIRSVVSRLVLVVAQLENLVVALRSVLDFLELLGADDPDLDAFLRSHNLLDEGHTKGIIDLALFVIVREVVMRNRRVEVL